MKPPEFRYHRPSSRAEAISLLAELGDEAVVLAGGQSLIPMLNMRLASPEHLIDINQVQDFEDLELVEGKVRIGAKVRQSDLGESAIAQRHCPILSDALAHVGHRPIRERGTVVGSIAHADPAAELPAVLLLLGGTVVTESAAAGSREILAADFFRGFFQTARRGDELVTAICFPQIDAEESWAFMEVARRSGDFAICGVGAIIGPASARIVVFGVEGRPRRFDVTDAVYNGRCLDESFVDLEPVGDIHASAEFRRHLASVLSGRALELAQQRRSET